MYTKKLTKRQKEVLEFIENYIETQGYSPNLREIAAFLGVKTPRGAQIHIKALERKGFIKIERHKARSIQLVKKYDGIPLVGISSAGIPIDSVEAIRESFQIDRKLTGSGEHFIIQITGDSMVQRGIYDGDLVVVKKEEADIKENDVVLVRLNNEVTLKTISMSGNTVILKPENPNYTPIKVSRGDSFEIIGKAVLVIKKL